VRVGGNTSFRTSNLVQATITVCGMETIIPVEENAEVIKVKQSENVKYQIIGADEFSKWFNLGFDDVNASA